MKTLKQFKQDIEIGNSIIVIKYKDEFTNEIPKQISGLKLITSKNTKGLYLKSITDEPKSKGIFWQYPKPNEVEYENNLLIEKNDNYQITYQIIN